MAQLLVILGQVPHWEYPHCRVRYVMLSGGSSMVLVFKTGECGSSLILALTTVSRTFLFLLCANMMLLPSLSPRSVSVRIMVRQFLVAIRSILVNQGLLVIGKLFLLVFDFVTREVRSRVLCSIPGFRFAGASGSVPVGHVCGGVTLVVMVVVATGMFTVVRLVFVSEGVWSLFKRHGSSKPFRCVPGITPCSYRRSTKLSTMVLYVSESDVVLRKRVQSPRTTAFLVASVWSEV